MAWLNGATAVLLQTPLRAGAGVVGTGTPPRRAAGTADERRPIDGNNERIPRLRAGGVDDEYTAAVSPAAGAMAMARGPVELLQSNIHQLM